MTTLAKRWIVQALASKSDNNGNEPKFMLMALTAPNGMFTAEELDALAHTYMTQAWLGKPDYRPALRTRMPAGTSNIVLARILATYEIVGVYEAMEPGGYEAGMRRWADFLRDAKRNAALGRAQFQSFIQHDEEFGANFQTLAAAEQFAYFVEASGYAEAAGVLIDQLIEKYRSADRDALRNRSPPMTVTLAQRFAPLLVLRAKQHLTTGNRSAAAKLLADASNAARQRLATEWKLGGIAAILAIRDLSDSLNLIAQMQTVLAAAAKPNENAAAAAALLHSMQLATFGETALTLGIANQNRLLATPSSAELYRERQLAEIDAQRLVEIEKRHIQFNYDRTLTAARQQAERQRDRLAAELAQIIPIKSQSVADIEPVSLAETRAALAKGETLVMLQAGADSVQGMLLDSDGRTTAWHSDVKRAEIEALVKSLQAGVDGASGTAPAFPFTDAAKLYRALFGAVHGRLASYKKLLIVSDGLLQSVPFNVLLTETRATWPSNADAIRAAALPWLVRSHAVALSPSVRNIVSQRAATQPSRASKPFLGIGNPRLGPPAAGSRSIAMRAVFAPSRSGRADISALSRLASLPDTETELRAIATALGGSSSDIVVGADAREPVVKALPLSQYKIITFATHGVLAGDVDGVSEPGLVLTPPAVATAEDDGFLALSEIADLKLDADLVILSACNTATSDGRPRAEGLSGLARGFFSAGARSLIVTYWAIPSQAATATTTGLTRNRQQNPRFDWAEALRESMLSVMDREGPAAWGHPIFWGAFVTVGVLPRP